MLKKITSITFIILSILVIVLWIITDVKKENKNDNSLSIITIYTAYSYTYKDNMEIDVSLYLNDKTNILKYKDSNTFKIKKDEFIMTLEASKIEVINEYKCYNDTYYEYLISFIIPSMKQSLLVKDANLEITNEIYTANINLGVIDILYIDDLDLFNFTKLYGTYSNALGELNLYGINMSITSDTSYSISDIRIGSVGYTNLDKATDKLLDNEVIVDSYDYYLKKSTGSINITLENTDLFIPVYFERPIYFEVFYILIHAKGKDYYIDSMSYKNGNNDPSEYISLLKEGSIKYA